MSIAPPIDVFGPSASCTKNVAFCQSLHGLIILPPWFDHFLPPWFDGQLCCIAAERVVEKHGGRMGKPRKPFIRIQVFF